MDKNNTPLVDEHLHSLRGMGEAVTDDFFYTRLMARMEKNTPEKVWNLPFRPVWVVGVLFVMLALNGFMLLQEKKSNNASGETVSGNSIQNFASSYDQSISSY